MQPVIINYKNTESLFDLDKLRYSGPIITAVQSMAKAYRQASDVLQPVLEMNIVIQRLLKSWKSPELRLEQSLVVGKIIDSLIEKYPKEKSLLTLRGNQSDILKSMLVLTEIGVSADVLPDSNVEQHWFKVVYDMFIKDESSGVQAVEAEWDSWNTPETFAEKLKKELNVPRLNAIYLQGFYYITPLQQRIIKAMCNLDVPIYYLNNCDEKHLDVYQVWHDNPEFKGLDKYQLPETDSDENLFCKFYDAEESLVPASQKLRIIEFKDIFSLVKYILKHQNEKIAFYSPMSKDLKNIFEVFFPVQEEKRHLLSYPIGQYLLSLYEMWDNDEGKVVFRPEHLRKCLSTGWAGAKHADGQSVLALYDKLFLYFEDCLYINEWRDRASQLRTVYVKILPLFDADRSKWNDIFAQPLKLYAPFSASPEEIDNVLEALENIIKDAELLFKNNRTIKLLEHFSDLANLLQRKESGSVIYEGEQEVVRGLVHRLKSMRSRIGTCTARQLSEAMRFFLGGNMDSEAEDTWQPETVRGLSDIEAATFLHKKAEITLCCCDATHLPGGPNPYSWPLSAEYFNNIKTLRSIVAERVNDYRYYMESTRLSDRYLFALAMRLPKLTASWVSEQQGKFLSASPYLTVLADITGIKKEQGADNMLAENETSQLDDVSLCKPILRESAFPNSTYPSEVVWNEDWCPVPEWRNLYDFILSSKVTYRGRFHLDYYLTALTAVLANQTGRSIEEVSGFVFNIVPTLDQAEREEIISFAKRLPGITPIMKDGKMFDGKEYQMARLYLKYLPVSKADAYSRKNTMPYDSKHKDEVCILCPHKDYCKGRNYI